MTKTKKTFDKDARMKKENVVKKTGFDRHVLLNGDCVDLETGMKRRKRFAPWRILRFRDSSICLGTELLYLPNLTNDEV